MWLSDGWTLPMYIFWTYFEQVNKQYNVDVLVLLHHVVKMCYITIFHLGDVCMWRGGKFLFECYVVKSIHLARESSVNQTYKFHGDIVIACEYGFFIVSKFLITICARNSTHSGIGACLIFLDC